jgi:hypothetical protein
MSSFNATEKRFFFTLKIKYLDHYRCYWFVLDQYLLELSAGGIRLWLSWLPVRCCLCTCLMGAVDALGSGSKPAIFSVGNFMPILMSRKNTVSSGLNKETASPAQHRPVRPMRYVISFCVIQKFTIEVTTDIKTDAAISV